MQEQKKSKMDENYLFAVGGFEKVIEHYVYSIYKSGMLLDEHDELLRNFCKIPGPQRQNCHYRICLSVVLFGSVISLRYKSPMPFAISLAPTILKCLHDGLDYLKKKNYKEEFSTLVKLLKNQFNLNKNIVQYFQKRKRTIGNFENTTREVIRNVMTAKVANFFLNVSKNLLDTIIVLKDSLEKIRDVDIGELNFIYVINVNLADFTNFEGLDEEVLLANFERLQLLYVLTTSTFLCGIGMALCVSEWKILNHNFIKLFSNIVPECCINVKKLHEIIANDFSNVCDFSTQVCLKDDNIAKASIDMPIFGSLKQFIHHIQVIFETANGIQTHLINEKSSNDTLLINGINDIENCMKQAKLSLNLMQHIVYRDLNNHENDIVRIHNLKCEDQSEGTYIIQHDDPDVVVDEEEFNLSIHESDTSSENELSDSMELEQFREVIKAQKCLIKELNNELKSRKLITQKEMVTKTSETSSNGNKCNMTNSKTQSELHTPTSSTMLKPPPMPSQLLKFTDNESTTRDFVSQIRDAACIWGVNEIVFEDSTTSLDSEEQDMIK